MSKVYDIEVFANSSPDASDRRWMALVRLHRKDDLACFSVSSDKDDAIQRATALGEAWQAKWDAGEESRIQRAEALRKARDRKAKAVA